MENNLNIIIIRHAKKLYKNGRHPSSSYKAHDPPLKYNEDRNIKEVYNIILDKFGEITHCLSSPYLRTRTTSEILLNNKIAININSDICEFLGYVPEPKPIIPEVNDLTKKYTIYNTNELYTDLVFRLKNTKI